MDHPPKRKWGDILVWFVRCFPQDELVRMSDFVPPGMNPMLHRWYVCISRDFSPDSTYNKGADLLYEISRILGPEDRLVRGYGFFRIETDNPECVLTFSWEGCGNSSQWTYRFDADPPEQRFLMHYPTRKALRVWKALPDVCKNWILLRFHDETVIRKHPDPALRFVELTLRAKRNIPPLSKRAASEYDAGFDFPLSAVGGDNPEPSP